MEPYELDAEKIINWAVSHADFTDLEKVAKAVYGIYVQRRKNDYPQVHKENRKIRRKLTQTGEFSKPSKKKLKWAKAKIHAERQLTLSAKRLK